MRNAPRVIDDAKPQIRPAPTGLNFRALRRTRLWRWRRLSRLCVHAFQGDPLSLRYVARYISLKFNSTNLTSVKNPFTSGVFIVPKRERERESYARGESTLFFREGRPSANLTDEKAIVRLKWSNEKLPHMSECFNIIYIKSETCVRRHAGRKRKYF